MRKVTSVLIAALLFQFIPASTSAGAAPKPLPLRITSANVKGMIASVTWTPQKLATKEFYEVEVTKKASTELKTSVLKTIKTKSVAIAIKLEPFTSYRVRVRKSLTPKNWTSVRSFSSTSNPLTGLTVLSSTYTSSELTWDATAGAT